MKKLIVNKKYDGKKLNKFLLENIPNLTYGLFCNTLRKKDIKINEKRINKDVSVYEGDEILVYIADSLLESKNQVNLDIIYEDLFFPYTDRINVPLHDFKNWYNKYSYNSILEEQIFKDYKDEVEAKHEEELMYLIALDMSKKFLY